MLMNLLFVFTMLFLIFWINTTRPANYPPGPSWVPLLGNLPILKYLKVFKFHHLLWQYLTKIYGPIVGLKFVNDFIVIVSGKEAIREFYGREEFNGRPNGFFFRVRSFDKRLGVVFTDGELWEEQRRFSIKTLKQLGMGKFSMVEHVEHEASELVESMRKECEQKKAIFMHNAFDISVLNVMWTLLGGERFELNDERLISLMKTIHKSFRIVDMSGGILNQFPSIRHIMPDKCGYRPLVQTMEPLWNFLKESINKIKSSVSPNIEPKSFIQAYCNEIVSRKSEIKFFNDDQLLALCVDFFQAGSETTSNTLGFGMLYMLKYPEVKVKVQNELDNVVGWNNLPKLSDRGKLKYTEAVICEIQRISNVAPLGIAHRALEDAKLGEFVIPKDTILLCSLYSLHMDVDYWKDPFVFRPERFLDDIGNLIMHENFMPFGMGKRRCIGESLAKSSLFLFFASFLHAFDIEPAKGETLPDLLGSDGITLSPNPYKVLVTKR